MADTNSLTLQINVNVKNQEKVAALNVALQSLRDTLANVSKEANEAIKSLSKLGRKYSLVSPHIKKGFGTTTGRGSRTSKTYTGKLNDPAPTFVRQKQATDSAAKSNDKYAKSVDKVGDSIDKTDEKVPKVGKTAERTTGIFGKLAGSLSKFAKLFGRIALYRAVRAMLKEISQAFQEGVQNLARYSSAFNGTMSSFSTSTLYLKNSIGAAVRPILELMIPALVQLIDWVVKAINSFNQLASVMSGKSTYTRAKKYNVDYAKSLDNTNEKAKKLQRTLLSFDEINKLDDNDSSSGSDTPDYSQMFEEVPIDKNNALVDFWNKVKEAIPTETLEHFKKAWDRLAKAVEKLSESKVWQTIRDWLARITGFSFGAIIEAFADWADALASILEFFEDPSWETFKTMIQDICDAILSFPDYIVTYFSTLIDDSNLPDWAKKLLHGLNKGLEFALKFTIPWFSIPTILRMLLDDEKRNKLTSDTEKSFTNVIKAIKDKFSIFEAPFREIQKWIETIFDIVKNDFENLKQIFSGVIDAWRAIKEKLGEIFNAIREIASAVWSKIWEKISGVINKIKEKFSPFFKAASEGFDNMWTKISEFGDKVRNKFKNLGIAISDFIGNAIKSMLNGLFGIIESKINGFINGLNSAISWVNSKLGTSINPVSPLKIPRFAQGGFPENGLFYANSTELVGEFDNGRTAVANNEQITNGIRRAAYEGFRQALAESGGTGSETRFIAELNGKTLFDEVVRQNNMSARTYGASPLTSY